MYPIVIGPSPLYIPLSPSSRQIVRAVPTRPRYCSGCPMLIGSILRTRKPPCACSFVLMTSNGQVTIPEASPLHAPAKACMKSFEHSVDRYSGYVNDSGGLCVISHTPGGPEFAFDRGDCGEPGGDDCRYLEDMLQNSIRTQSLG